MNREEAYGVWNPVAWGSIDPDTKGVEGDPYTYITADVDRGVPLTFSTGQCWGGKSSEARSLSRQTVGATVARRVCGYRVKGHQTMLLKVLHCPEQELRMNLLNSGAVEEEKDTYRADPSIMLKFDLYAVFKEER